jgi:hypothetical protein
VTLGERLSLDAQEERHIGAALVFCWTKAEAQDPRIERGKYLVTVISCSDCHTNGALIGKPDMAHFLAGSEIGFTIPELGYFYGPNPTPRSRDRPRKLDDGPDRDGDHPGSTPRRPHPGAHHAMAFLRPSDIML